MSAMSMTGSLPLPTRLGIARCCRDWPVNYSYPIRKCGECGEVPIVVAILAGEVNV